MNKMNRFKLAVMAGACITCVMVPASLAFSDYSDELLVDSYYGDILETVGRQDALIRSDDDFLTEEDILTEETEGDGILLEEQSGDVLLEEDIRDDDILVPDNDEIYDELTIEDSGDYNKDDRIEGSTEVRVYEPSSMKSDILLTTPVVTTPTPTPGPAESKTVKAAMGGASSGNKEATTAADGTKAASSTIDKVIKEINAKRAAAGVAPLSSDSTLNYVATQRVKETARKFSHTRPNGKESVTILSDYGVSAGRSGENIACCISSPEGVVAAWANSPSHNRCMLNSDYSNAGVGTMVSDGVTYWVLILTN